MTLIDADKFLGELYDEHDRHIEDMLKSAYASWTYRWIKELYLSQPIVDAAPVRHGHWVSLTDCSNAGVYCSVCNKKVYKEDYAPCNKKNKLRSNYCPNCGAKMDESEENY